MTPLILRFGAAGLLMLLALAAGCGGETEPRETAATSAPMFSVRQVQREFRKHGLPLTEEPSAFPELDGMRAFTSERGGPVFQVEVHFSIELAMTSLRAYYFLSPPNYRIRGPVYKQRKANVTVLYENGRAGVRRQFRAALAALRQRRL